MLVKRVLLTIAIVVGFIFAPYYAGVLFGMLFLGSAPPTILIGWLAGAVALVVLGIVCRFAWGMSRDMLK